jgi:lysozyme
MNRNFLFNQLVDHEGIRLFPYVDTKGKTTIGVGRNLTDRGISTSEAHHLCWNDIDIAERALDRNARWWRTLPEIQQRVLAEMCFQLGWTRLAKFEKFLAALQHGDDEAASAEMLDSLWADQTDGKEDGKIGNRAKKLAKMILEV